MCNGTYKHGVRWLLMVAARVTFLLGEVERPHTTIQNRVVEASRCSIVRNARIEKKSQNRDDGAGPRFARSFEAVLRNNVRGSVSLDRCYILTFLPEPRGSSWNFSHVARSKTRFEASFRSVTPTGLCYWSCFCQRARRNTFRGEFSIAASDLRK